jgi:hypothetical protein
LGLDERQLLVRCASPLFDSRAVPLQGISQIIVMGSSCL